MCLRTAFSDPTWHLSEPEPERSVKPVAQQQSYLNSVHLTIRTRSPPPYCGVPTNTHTMNKKEKVRQLAHQSPIGSGCLPCLNPLHNPMRQRPFRLQYHSGKFLGSLAQEFTMQHTLSVATITQCGNVPILCQIIVTSYTSNKGNTSGYTGGNAGNAHIGRHWQLSSSTTRWRCNKGKKVIQQNEEWTNMYVCMYVLRPPGQQIPSQDPDSFPIR